MPDTSSPRDHKTIRTSADITWSVGTVSERLGISASTLRTWERRYGLGPTLRTSGGHRRYSSLDIDRVDLMRRLLARGVSAQQAATVAKQLAGDHAPNDPLADPSQLSSSSSNAVDQILACAHRLNGRELASLANAALREHGAVEAWDAVFVPALAQIGDQWADGRLGVEGEHLASTVIESALHAHARRQPLPELTRTGTVVMACAEDEGHRLPVVALDAALSEHGVTALDFGARLPASALNGLLETMRPQVLLLWASLPRPPRDPVLEVLEKVDDSVLVVLAGPGWPELRRSPGGIRDTVERVLSRALT